MQAKHGMNDALPHVVRAESPHVVRAESPHNRGAVTPAPWSVSADSDVPRARHVLAADPHNRGAITPAPRSEQCRLRCPLGVANRKCQGRCWQQIPCMRPCIKSSSSVTARQTLQLRLPRPEPGSNTNNEAAHGGEKTWRRGVTHVQQGSHSCLV